MASLPQHYILGSVKEIRAFRPVKESQVRRRLRIRRKKFPALKIAEKDVWITLCRGDVQFGRQNDANSVEDITVGQQAAAGDRMQNDLARIQAAAGATCKSLCRNERGFRFPSLHRILPCSLLCCGWKLTGILTFSVLHDAHHRARRDSLARGGSWQSMTMYDDVK